MDNNLNEPKKINNNDNSKSGEGKIATLRNKLKYIFYDYNLKSAKVQTINVDGFRDEEIVKIPSYIIMPNSKWKFYWNFLIYLITFYSLFFVPLDIAFSKYCFIDSTKIGLYNALDLISSILYSMAIAFKFLTAIYNKKGFLEFNLREIATAYLKTTFALDLVSALPFSFIVGKTSQCGVKTELGSKFISFFVLIRLSKISQLNDVIEKSNTKFINLVRLIKLLLFFYYVCQFIGCIIVGATLKIKTVESNLKGEHTLYNFFYIYTFSMMTGITTILGSSDPDVFQPEEKMLVTFINIISLAITANIFGYVALIIEKINSSNVINSKLLSDKIDLINEYLIYENINENLRVEVNEFYKFMYIRQRMLFEEKIYDKLNPNLMSTVKLELWKGAYFIKDKLFVLNVISPYFFNSCLEVLAGRIYKKGDIIVEEGENSIDLYLLCTNSVCEVYCNGLLMNILYEGDYFGETALFTSSKKRTATVISKSDGDYLYIPGKSFYKLLLDYEAEREFFSNIAMKYLLHYNTIITPQQYSLFISKKDKIYNSLVHKNLYKNPPVQKNLLFYKRNFEDESNNNGGFVKNKNSNYSEIYQFNEELDVLNSQDS